MVVLNITCYRRSTEASGKPRSHIPDGMYFHYLSFDNTHG